MNPIFLTIPAALFLAIDSGSFYAESYPALQFMGYALASLAYAAFLALSSRRDLPARLVLIGFIIINTLSAAMGAGGEVVGQWEKTIAIKNAKDGADGADGLRELALTFSGDGQKLNAAKNADAYREMVTESVKDSKPLAWAKISLILVIRFLLEMSILLLSANPINKRTQPQSTARSANGQPRQLTLKGVFITEEKLRAVIDAIETKGGVNFRKKTFVGEDAKELLAEAKELLARIKTP